MVSARLLDTDVCIDVLRGRDPSVPARLRAMGAVAVSSITVAELGYGAAHSWEPDRNREEVRRFLDAIDVMEFDDDAAWMSGEVRHALAVAGAPIGAYDVLIAGHALATDSVLVTRNVREFQRVEGLQTTAW